MPKNKIAKIDLKDAIVNGMLEKKAHKITVLDLRKLSSAMADYFVICHATSDKQVNAIADSIEEIVNQGENVGKNETLAGQKIMVEYTQPNPFKPFHIGHLMSNAIGESISRIVTR